MDDIASFRTLITAFGTELNQQVRRNPEFKAELAVDQQTERQYFGVPAMPDALKALLDGVPAMLEARFAEGAILASLGEAEGETEIAKELLEELGQTRPVPAHIASQLSDAVIRAGHVLGSFTKLDPKGVLARGTALAEQMQARIQALDAFDQEDLHDAYVNDIEKAVAGLREKAGTIGELVTELRDALRQLIPLLSGQVATMKKTLA